MNKIDKADLKKWTGLRVKDLKEFVEKYNVPDDALIMIERVEDFYYEKQNLGDGQKIEGWVVYLKEGQSYYDALSHNKRIREGFYFNKEDFPNIEEGSEALKELTDEELERSKNQYHPAWSCVKYKDDDDLLFINLHY